MKVTGFTFIKNAIKYDYPIVAAIQSILPICDEFVVAVGNSEDATRELIQSIDSKKIRILDTVWDENVKDGGRILALETDKAFQAIDNSSDWAFYIQGDEVIHEKYLETIEKAMKEYKDDSRVDGLLFHYLHFYGSYDFTGVASQWYRHEIRVIKNNNSFYSYRDAQGFRKGDNKKLNVIPIDAYVYHYGWVKPPAVMEAKNNNSLSLYHGIEWVKKNMLSRGSYDYAEAVTELNRFTGDHPAVMKERIEKQSWEFDYDISNNRKTTKERFKHIMRKYVGIDISYKNYLIVK